MADSNSHLNAYPPGRVAHAQLVHWVRSCLTPNAKASAALPNGNAHWMRKAHAPLLGWPIALAVSPDRQP